MCDYKLTYFDERGRAEPIRLIFTFAEIPFEDVRIKKEEWDSLKSATPWGQIPILQIGDKTIAQTTTIARFLAKRFNLIGSNEFEATKCEELVDSANDFMFMLMKFVYDPNTDQAKKDTELKNLIENVVPKCFEKFNTIQKQNGGTWLVGDSVTWADIWFADVFETVENILGVEILNKYENIKKLKKTFFNIPHVKEYVDKRPKK